MKIYERTAYVLIDVEYPYEASDVIGTFKIDEITRGVQFRTLRIGPKVKDYKAHPEIVHEVTLVAADHADEWLKFYAAESAKHPQPNY